MPKLVATKFRRNAAVASTFPRWDDPRTFQKPCASQTSPDGLAVAAVDFRPFPKKEQRSKGQAHVMSDVYLNILL